MPATLHKRMKIEASSLVALKNDEDGNCPFHNMILRATQKTKY